MFIDMAVHKLMFGHATGPCRASDFPREYDGACLQMRMSYSPAAHLFLFLVQWTDCNLAGALGLLRILIYKVHCLFVLKLFILKGGIRQCHKFVSWCRFMWMAQPPCLHTREKQVLENSMVFIPLLFQSRRLVFHSASVGC